MRSKEEIRECLKQIETDIETNLEERFCQGGKEPAIRDIKELVVEKRLLKWILEET